MTTAKKIMNATAVVGCLVGVLMFVGARSALAGWTKIDDFESYATNTTIVGQGGWVGGGFVSSKVIADPDNAANKVVEVSFSAAIFAIALPTCGLPVKKT